MFTLKRAQANFMDTINNGPDALDIQLFSGPIDRVILGLKAHANTINHARLVALEETFPRTVEQMGAVNFNNMARAYIETDEAKQSDNNGIGAHFSAFLQNFGCDPQTADLARIEWAWLQSYHAADQMALSLADLAQFSESELLSQHVKWHPSTRLIVLGGDVPNALPELAVAKNSTAVLVVRPDAEVRLLALDNITTQVASAAENSTTIGNLLALSSEQGEDADPIGPVLTLIGVGALIAME
jgi:Putative DNA-binding domain